jgi:glycosyltransferase involved in cell wall biosynthesis
MRELLDTCVVVPMFNEAAVVGSVVTELTAVFGSVVCVDDGSSDASARLARDAGAVVLRHPVNLGMGAALQTGLTWGLRDHRHAYFVTFDADGQHRVDDAARMVRRARAEELDVVLGTRFGADGATTDMPRSRRALLRAAVRFTRLTSGMALTDAHNGLRVLDRRAAERIRITLSGMAHASEVLDQIRAHRLRWAEEPVTIDYTEYSRGKGQPGINAINISLDLLGNRLRTSPLGRRQARA